MKKLFPLSLVAAASAALLAQPAMAKQDNIVVMPVSEKAFVEKVSEDLNRQLVHASRYNRTHGEGIAIVRFTRDEKGEPADITVYRGSGRGKLDRIAMQAVSRLDTLAALPSSVGKDQVYQANIIFASGDAAFRDLSRQLKVEEAARLAASPAEAKIVALGSIASRPRS